MLTTIAVIVKEKQATHTNRRQEQHQCFCEALGEDPASEAKNGRGNALDVVRVNYIIIIIERRRPPKAATAKYVSSV